MTVMTILPFILGFIICAIGTPIAIPLLRRLKVGNTEREELKSHQVKSGTPTMGGIVIVIAIVAASIPFWRNHPGSLPVILMVIGFALIGFLDDFLKVVLKRSDGLIAWQKFLLQIIVTVAFIVWYAAFSGRTLIIPIPFTSLAITNPIAVIVIMFLAILGTVNGANFTDGVDGLASSVTLIIAAFFAIVSHQLYGGVGALSLAVAGALLAFLLFNAYPAKVFMGDTGSLALGGFVSGAGFMLGIPIVAVIVSLIYWAEILSVMIQVSYFKATHGKRVFRMAPIHHHFELGGWSEVRVVTVFSVITIFLCGIGYVAIF